MHIAWVISNLFIPTYPTSPPPYIPSFPSLPSPTHSLPSLPLSLCRHPIAHFSLPTLLFSLSLPLSFSPLPPSPSLPPSGFALMLGLASFSRAYHDTHDTHASWSYTVGWIAFLFSLVCAAYFILIAVHRMRTPYTSKNAHNPQQSSYTPLAQFEESSDSSSEEDEKL